MKPHTGSVAAVHRTLTALLCLAAVLAVQLPVAVTAVAAGLVHDCECLPEMCHCRHDGAASCHSETDHHDRQGCTEKGDQLITVAWDAPPALGTSRPVETASGVNRLVPRSVPTVDAEVDTLPPRPAA
ncbi:MAG: hypothetical protein GY953_55110 [bacterium]|nr:hypothetical protein [bacterium]